MPPSGTIQTALSRMRGRVAACDRYDLAAAALFATLVVLAIVTYDSYAISNDEAAQQRHLWRVDH